MESMPSGSLEGAFVIVISGDSAGKELPVGKVLGNIVFIGVNPFGADNSKDIKAIKAGDQVILDNSDFLAAEYYHRHQVPTPDFYAWDQFRGPDGKPLEPQRSMLIGPMVTGAGSVQSGRFKGKMILVESIMDQDALPWQATGIVLRPRRLSAIASTTASDSGTSNTPSILMALARATPRTRSVTCQIFIRPSEVPGTAAERKGIQPVVSVMINGGERAEVRIGRPATFTAVIDVPPATGKVVSAAWDFEGEGTFSTNQDITGSNSSTSGSQVRLKITHTFTKPGTYFPALLATSQRDGDANSPFTRIPNLGKVRVIVK